MKYDFSVDELITLLAALRAEFVRASGCAIIARKKLKHFSDDRNRMDENITIAQNFDMRCESCKTLYKKIIGKDIEVDI